VSGVARAVGLLPAKGHFGCCCRATPRRHTAHFEQDIYSSRRPRQAIDLPQRLVAPVNRKEQPGRLGLLLAVRDKCKDCNEARASKVATHELKPAKRGPRLSAATTTTLPGVLQRITLDGTATIKRLLIRAAACRSDDLIQVAV
jgi:hypothetical protein